MPKNRVNFLFILLALIVLVSGTLMPAKAALPSIESLLNKNAQTRFLPVSAAFPFNFIQDNNKLKLEWKITEGYYLYQDKLTVTPTNSKIAPLNLPSGLPYEDQYFGAVTIYRNQLEMNLEILEATENASLSIGYQGCADAGFCYPPETITVPLTALGAKANNTQLIDYSATDTPANASGQSTSVTSLSDNWWQPLLFLLLGIGLAFTPCVLPMYPILTGIVLGGGKKTHAKTFSLSLVYVQGMALTYTLLGLVVASAGVQFQAALQHPYVLITISILFVALAAAMFGAFSLELPAKMQTQLAKLSNDQKGGSYGGVFIMGAISGLICSPCTTAPLSGALLYVAQSGDLFTGAITLYALAIGMGIPLILAAIFGNKLLPKAGAWMQKIKVFFGFILLCAPIFFLERLLPTSFATALWAIWLLSISGWLYHTSREMIPSKIASFIAIIGIFGLNTSAFVGYQLMVKPASVVTVNNHLPFVKVKTVADLERELARAKASNKAVMLDFYADWCVACKEFEQYTFADSSVQSALTSFVLLQADVTRNDKQDVELLKRLQVLGLPTIDFWDSQGNYVTDARLSGFANAEAFLAHLKRYAITP